MKVLVNILSLIILFFCFSNQNLACVQILSKLKVKSLKGKIVFKKSPIPNATIKVLKKVKKADDEDEFTLIDTQTTDKKGIFNFPNLSKGNYIIWVETNIFEKFWGEIKITKSKYRKRLKRRIVIKPSLPTKCNASWKLEKITN